MRLRVLLATFLVSAGLNWAQKPIQLADILAWKRIQTPAVSNNGEWFAYRLGPAEGDAEVVNTLYGSDGARHAHTWKRLPGSYHGSGCTLASAIAAQLALGRTVVDAALAAQDYTWRALQAGFRPAGGQFLPCRFPSPQSRAAVP
jgi:hypothetical protein